MSAVPEITVAALGPSEARRLTDQVKRDAQELWKNHVRLHEGGAHTALGYGSWGAYFEAEFGQHRVHGYRLLKAAEVAGALESNPGVTERQARELAPVLRDEGEAALLEVWRELREEYGDDLSAVNIKSAVEGRVLRAQRAAALREERLGAERAVREAVALSRAQGAMTRQLTAEASRRRRIADLLARIAECDEEIERGRRAAEAKAKFEAELRDLEDGGPA